MPGTFLMRYQRPAGRQASVFFKNARELPPTVHGRTAPFPPCPAREPHRFAIPLPTAARGGSQEQDLSGGRADGILFQRRPPDKRESCRRPVIAPNKKSRPRGRLVRESALLLFSFLGLADRLLKELVVAFDDLAVLFKFRIHYTYLFDHDNSASSL